MKEGPNIKELYEKGVNIMHFFRAQENSEVNTADSILYAYDMQSGSYTACYDSGQVMERAFLVDGEKKRLTMREFKRINGQKIASVLQGLEYQTFLEVGVGEGTTLCDVFDFVEEEKTLYALDLSLSRLIYAQRFFKRRGLKASFCLGDLFALPFLDSSIDVVFTSHCIEPNTGREEAAVRELYRVAKRYVVMVEPSYEFGNRETRERIEQNRYIRGLKAAVDRLGYPILRYEPFGASVYENNSELLVLEKETSGEAKNPEYACPRCGRPLKLHKDNLYCGHCLVIYPIIGGVPILTENQALLCSKYMEWI